MLEFPSKHLMEDAMQLSKHLQNRGRPTERTWAKYKEAKAVRKQLRGLWCTSKTRRISTLNLIAMKIADLQIFFYRTIHINEGISLVLVHALY